MILQLMMDQIKDFLCFPKLSLQQDQFSESLNDLTDADDFTRRARINSKTWQQLSFVSDYNDLYLQSSSINLFWDTS